LRKPYVGSQVDIFALGIVLFVMVMRCNPFSEANAAIDVFYRAIKNKSVKFWAHFGKHRAKYNMPPLSDEIKDLITGCLQFEPNERPSVSEALSHSWFNLETATDQEIQEEFEPRNYQTKTKWEAELSDRMKMRENFIEQLRESNYRANEMPAKKLTEPTLTNNVVFTTALAPTYVEKALTDYLSDKEMKYTTNNDEYKVQFVWGKKSGEMPTAINDDEIEELLDQQMGQLESLAITMCIAEMTPETADQPAVYRVEFSTEE